MRIRCVSSPYQITTVFGSVEGYPLNNGFHTGVDYISDGRILAPSDSNVAGIGYDSTNGNYLILESPNHRDWFAHIKTGGYLVSTGQTVKRGQHIAWQGRTGSASGVHVHHSLRKNGVMVDPELNITEDEMITDSDNEYWRWNKLFLQIRGRSASRTEFRTYAVGLTWLRAMELLSDSPEADAATNKAAELSKVITIKDGEITRLSKEVESLKAQVGESTKWQTLRTLLRELLGI